MSSTFIRCSTRFLVGGALTVMLFGCVAYGGGYGYDGGANIGATYYEPWGFGYSTWGPGYQVGPYYRDHGRYYGGSYRNGGGRPQAHAYRAAPSSRTVPSLASGARSGGHSGGGHSGGGGRR